MKMQPLSEKGGSMVLPSAHEALGQLDREEMIRLCKNTGAVYFQGFNADVSAFEAFSNRFSDDYMDNTGSGSYRENVEGASDSTIQNVAYVYGVNKQRTFGLPMHADRSYVKSQPPLVWFLCIRPCREGGQTTVCDGVRFYQTLSESAKNLFNTKKLKYIRYYDKDEWQVLFKTEDFAKVRDYCQRNDLALTEHGDGSVTTEYLKSAVVATRFGHEKAFANSILIQLWQEEDLGRQSSRVRLEDGSKIPADIMDEVKQVAEDLTIELPWQPGDFVMVDNIRMMHGRRPFTDHEREVYVRMCRSIDW